VYNAIGFSVAASGALSPLFAALLMPASSLTVVGIAWLGTKLIHQGTRDYPA
jgi:Cu+-exporting ATPase